VTHPSRGREKHHRAASVVPHRPPEPVVGGRSTPYSGLMHQQATGSPGPTALRRGWSRARSFVARRARTGAARARAAVVPAALSAVCAVLAYAFAEFVLGHEDPLFAATASLIALGFNREPKVRKVLEVAAGCTLGILVGDLMQAV